MKAIRIHEYGDSSVLRYEDAPTPEIGPSEVLIKVHSAGVNPIDWKTRQGGLKDLRPYEMPLILGWDVAGTVERIGSVVTRFKVGDKVFSKPDSGRNGAYAEYIAVRSDEVALAPKTIPLEQSAGIPLAATTAWISLFEKADLQAGQTILIHAASGGVGTFAVQLAKAVGVRVIGTTSTANVDLIKSLGADEVIDYRSEDFSKKVKDVDVVLDTLGGETRAKSWQVLRKGGILVSLLGRQEPFDEAMVKQYEVRAVATSLVANGARLEDITGLVDAGKLRVVVGKEFPLSEAKAAHELSEGSHAVGKIILRVIQ